MDSSVPLGVTIAALPALGVPGALEVATRAESMGYRSFWTAEVTGAEAFSVLAAAGGVAPTLGLGTGVLALQLRTPMLAAMGAATLQALHPDAEIVLGVGISSPVVTTRWHGAPYGERPVERTREFVSLVKELLTGETVTYEGEFYSCNKATLGVRLGERRPKVVVGALNPRMLRMAGEVADGVLLNYLPSTHVPWSVEQIRAGGDATVYAYVHCSASEREDGIQAARRDLFSYAAVDSYARSFDRAGFGDEVAAIRAAHAARDREGALAAVSDRMVDAIDLMADPAGVAAYVQAYVDAGVEVPVLMPNPWGPDRMQVVDDTLRAAITA